MLKKRNILWVGFCATLVLFTSCTKTEEEAASVVNSATSSEAQETVYTIGDIAFTIEGDWTIDSTEKEIGIVFFEDSDNGIVARMAILAPQSLDGQSMNKASVGLMLGDMIWNIDKNAQVSYVQETALENGSIVYTMEALMTVNDVEIKAYIWLIKYEDELCMALYSATPNEYDLYLDDAKQIVDTASRN